MDKATLLHRQVHPSWVQEGRASSQTFKPTPKDAGKVSVYFTTSLKLSSVGCMSVTVEECEKHSLAAVADSEPYKEHCFIDMTNLSEGDRKKKAARVTELARARGWTFQPSKPALPTSDFKERAETA